MFYKRLIWSLLNKIENDEATDRDIELYLVLTAKLFYFENV